MMSKYKTITLLVKKKKVEFQKAMDSYNLASDELEKINLTIEKLKELISGAAESENQPSLPSRYLRGTRELKQKLYERLNISNNRYNFLQEQVAEQSKELALMQLSMKQLVEYRDSEKLKAIQEKEMKLEIAESRRNLKQR
ncbi:MAG: hypothetical protein CMM25_07635 [Rhodospirillaceae bacterium]|nr:hypothetical protein [Rhodospirillaceae bacterium]